MTANLPELLDAKRVAPFRFRRLGEKWVVTNDYGRWRLLDDAGFKRFVSGDLGDDPEAGPALAEDGFVRERLDFDALTRVWKRRAGFLWQGPGLHIVVVTLRCNHRCVYCHASPEALDAKGVDMTEETARGVVDRIFESPSPALTIEFQGGEPLANWPVVKFVVDYALEKNKAAKRSLWLNLVSNLSLLDEEKLEFLLDRGVNFCTSLDGPADVHDRNRTFLGGSSHALVRRWFDRIRKATKGKAFRIDALLTCTRFTLDRWKDVVDEYVSIGARGVFLRPLNPYGLATRTWDVIGYTPEEFLGFYVKALDYILELNAKKRFFEQSARLYLAKILGDDDPNFLDLRSPCGAGIGQLAYNFDGSIYTCDEGRMLSRMGDDTFKIGANETRYAEAAAHPAVRALAVASCLDNQPVCSECAYKPYCGICPIQCYSEQGDIMGRMPANARCRVSKGVLDALFERLDDPERVKVFRAWLRRRDRSPLYQRS